MTRKKRLLSRTMMALLLSLTLSACGGQQATESSDTVQQSSETQQSSEEAEQSESSSASSEQSDAGSQESDTNQSAEATDLTEFVYNVKEFEIPDNEGIRMVQNMKIGWNLGNSFDAIDCNLADEMKYESAWCGANATPELFAELKKAGFIIEMDDFGSGYLIQFVFPCHGITICLTSLPTRSASHGLTE